MLVLFLLLLYHSLQLCLQLQNPLPILAHVDTQPEPEAKGRLCLQMLLLPRLQCESPQKIRLLWVPVALW